MHMVAAEHHRYFCAITFIERFYSIINICGLPITWHNCIILTPDPRPYDDIHMYIRR